MIYPRFRKFVTDAGLLEAGDRVLAAVSGGSDSTAMLHLLSRLAADRGLVLHAACVNHGIRPEAKKEAAFAASLAASWNIPFSLLEGDAAKKARQEKKSLQHAARDLRYELLEGLAGKIRAAKLALGHTLDDQAETVIMNLVRGCGLDGLGGMAPRRDGMVRPVLIFRRQELMDYLRDRGISWVSDPSNEDPAFLRPRVRHVVMPLLQKENPGAPQLLARLADEARDAVRFLDGEADLFLERHGRRRGGEWVLDRKAFAALPAALGGHVVRRIFLHTASTLLGFYRPHVEHVLGLARKRRGSSMVHLGGGITARREYDALIIGRPRKTAPAGGEVEVTGEGTYRHEGLGVEIEVKAEKKKGLFPLVLRSRRRGDRITGRKKTLKKILIDGRVPRYARDFVPVLAAGSRVLWAGGLARAQPRDPGLTVKITPLEPLTPFTQWATDPSLFP
jgi:tRNA(Ile)-lysidine synthase